MLQTSLFHDTAMASNFKTHSDSEAEFQKDHVEKYEDNEHIASDIIVAENARTLSSY